MFNKGTGKGRQAGKDDTEHIKENKLTPSIMQTEDKVIADTFKAHVPNRAKGRTELSCDRRRRSAQVMSLIKCNYD